MHLHMYTFGFLSHFLYVLNFTNLKWPLISLWIGWWDLSPVRLPWTKVHRFNGWNFSCIKKLQTNCGRHIQTYVWTSASDVFTPLSLWHCYVLHVWWPWETLLPTFPKWSTMVLVSSDTFMFWSKLFSLFHGIIVVLLCSLWVTPNNTFHEDQTTPLVVTLLILYCCRSYCIYMLISGLCSYMYNRHRISYTSNFVILVESSTWTYWKADNWTLEQPGTTETSCGQLLWRTEQTNHFSNTNWQGENQNMNKYQATC